MGLESAVDFEAIGRPIDGDTPAGRNLRLDSPASSPYYQLKEARNSARTSEREEESGGSPATPAAADWQRIRDMAPGVLANESKDLEIGAWLVEALCRLDGFGGLAAGFRVLRVLVEGFWEGGLWPQPDEEGVATRVAPLAGLNGEDAAGTLIAPIASVPILIDASGNPLATWQFKKARDISRIDDPERRERALSSAGATLETFQAAVARTPAEDLRLLRSELEECLEEYRRLEQVLDGVCGQEAPPASQIRAALEDVLDTVQSLGRDKLSDQGEAGGEIPGAATTGGGAELSSSTSVRGREEAFGALVRVADFFRRTEPHSPLSYLLERAVRWGRLPLHQLLDELIPDEGARTEYMKLTGIPLPERE